MLASNSTPIESNDGESTGNRPEKHESAKRTARRKALVAQLLDPVLVAESPETLQAWGVGTYLAFKPRDAWEDWLTQQVAVIMVQINRTQRVERRLRDWASYRAIDFWEDDQKLAVETLALGIAANPGKVVAELRMTPSGCDWLSARWQTLARIGPADWTPEQRTLAENLLGGAIIHQGLPGLAEANVAALATQRTRIEEADAVARSLVEADLSDQLAPDLKRLRNYERTLHRRLRWFVAQLRVEPPDRWDNPRYKPSYTAPLIEPVAPTAPAATADVAALPENDKTNPLSNARNEANPDPKNDETNPIEPVQPVRSATLNDRKPVDLEQLVIKEAGGEARRASDRKRRIDPIQAVERQRKAKRRSA